jgi:fatty acid-binding protein DegV
MIPLAVSGRIVIVVAVVGALLLVWVLLRLDTRDEAAQKAEEEQAARKADRDE